MQILHKHKVPDKLTFKVRWYCSLLLKKEHTYNMTGFDNGILIGIWNVSYRLTSN